MKKITKNVINLLITIIYLTAMVFVWLLVKAITIELADDIGFSDTLIRLVVISTYIIYYCITIIPLVGIISVLNFKKEKEK